MDDIACDLQRVADNLASFVGSSAKTQAACTVAVQGTTAAMQQCLSQQAEHTSSITDSLQEINANCAAMATCLCDQSETLNAMCHNMVAGAPSTSGDQASDVQASLDRNTMAMGELQATAAGIVAEVKSLGLVILANTAAVGRTGAYSARPTPGSCGCRLRPTVC